MFMGVPYVPFAIGAGACLLMTFYFNMFFLALLPVVIFVMRQMARQDEMIFRLLALRWLFRSKVRNLAQRRGAWGFSQNSYRKDLQVPGRSG